MNIRIEYLTQIILGPFQVTCNRADVSSIEFSDLYLLTGKDSFSPSHIHIGMVSQLPAQPPKSDEDLTFVCIEDKPLPKKYQTQKHLTMVLCPAETSLQELVNQVNLLLTNVVDSTNDLWQFASQIASGNTFTQLMRTAVDILHCPCAILSQGFKLLGYAVPENITPSSTWSTTISRKYYPYFDIISKISTTSLTICDPATHLPVEDPKHYPETGDAFFPIRSEDSNKELLGFLYLSYQDLHLILVQQYLLQFIAYALEFRMWRYINSPSKENSVLCFLFRDIINGSLNNDEEIRTRLRNINIPMPKNLFLVTVYTSAMENRTYSWSQLQIAFSQISPDDVLFAYNGDLLLLLSSDEPALPDETLKRLSAALKEYGCYAGISACFHAVDRSLKNHYARTLAAAKMARMYDTESRYSTFEDVAVLYLIHTNSSMENMRDLCDPRILLLTAYDRNHASDYIYTLQCYWHFNQNVQQTCDHLFIHRNTLFYRLKKIKEIVNLDFTNVKHLIQFHLSFSILTSLGEIPYITFSDSEDTEPDVK